ncbi:MAG: 1-acyl-sn-glycerol-3-phosphate acyltransferase [Gammaproteobacteria bacterium]|nr:MAG: 1-acyl-sn-glycerol-3-phosphate acyltransferase [Gammaproteobacteria bacterium]
MKHLRALLFYVPYIITGMMAGSLSIILWPTPFLFRYKVIMAWNDFAIWWLRITCNIRYNIIGTENIPPAPYVVLSKHQSTWETLFLQTHFQPISTILKKELLRIPFFGWGLALLKPIAIDRSNPREAIKHIHKEGVARIEEGLSVLVFPEGTRTPYGGVGNYARGGAGIACSAGVPIVAVAHNAGACWPVPGFVKHAGTITVVISSPFDTTGRNSKELTEEVKTWIESEISRMPDPFHR